MKNYAPGDLGNDGGCLDLHQYVGTDGTEKRTVLHRYRFDPEQEHKIRVGDRLQISRWNEMFCCRAARRSRLAR